jgi:hypothetical protein
MPEHKQSLPLWLKLTASAYLCVFIPVYWQQLGPQNFLWFSDIALIVTVLALWRESRFLISMMAVSVLFWETLWNVDFFTRLIFGVHLFGLNATIYMFKPETLFIIKAISFSFHFFLPIILAWGMFQLGYDRRAWKAQTLLAWVVFPISYLVSDPAANINWVFGLGSAPQEWLHPLLYLLALMLASPLLIYLPSHYLLIYLFGDKNRHH